MLKRLGTLLITVAMVATIFAGCGKKDTGNVTLKWILFNAKQKDAEMVEEAVNKELAKHMDNTKLEIVYETGLGSKWSMMMAAKEEYDIAWTGYTLNMGTALSDGTYMALGELVEKYAPNI